MLFNTEPVKSPDVPQNDQNATQYQPIPEGGSDNGDGTFTIGGRTYKKKVK